MEPNRFGTAKEMVINEVDVHGVKRIMAIDAKGLYLTTADMVGRNVADVNRYGVDRQEFQKTLESLGYDVNTIFEENQHLVTAQEQYVSKEKKVNPIKASKRGG